MSDELAPIPVTHYALVAEDGHTAIMQLVVGADLEEAVEKFSQTAFMPKRVVQIDPATIPSDRTYRDAWTHDGKKFTHDMAKAREVHKGYIRLARKPMLEALDVEMTRAIASGDSKAVAAIEAKRQKLRDATKDSRIAVAATTEQLKKVVLE